MELVKPYRLKTGDTIRIVAPASNMASLSKSALERGIKNLENLGFEVELHPHVFRSYKGTGGKPKERAKSLMDAFTEDSVDGIMCCWGGFNSNDIIDYLDYGIIRKNPKVFVGYSDITILNTVLYKKAGLINFHGPALITFTHDFLMPWEVNQFKDITMNGNAQYEIKPAPSYIDDPLYWQHPETSPVAVKNPGWTIVKDGIAKGRLIGGHLGTLLCLAGTKYWPDLKEHILFLEADEEDVGPANVVRQLRHLHQLGVFDDISGLLVGRIPSMLGLKDEMSIESLLEDVVDRDIPVVTQMDIGHTNPIATVPVGINAEISTKKHTLTLLEAVVQ
jgi:muramoyltetrapeptide carboxypeptidase